MLLETLMKLCMTELEFLEKNFFAPKIVEMVESRPKIGFLNLKKNLAINFISSIMKIYIICCVSAQSLYWEKSCS